MSVRRRDAGAHHGDAAGVARRAPSPATISCPGSARSSSPCSPSGWRRGRGQGHPDLPCRRHGDGDIQDVGRIVDLSRRELLRIAGVPLFSGFMYAAVGSYLRPRPAHLRHALSPLSAAWRPSRCASRSTSISSPIISCRTCAACCSRRRPRYTGAQCVHYRVFRFRHRMPLLLGFLLVALFIWFAENIGTWSRAWIYPGQADEWTPVSIAKLGAWYLLMIISFVLVALVHRPRPVDRRRHPRTTGKDPAAAEQPPDWIGDQDRAYASATVFNLDDCTPAAAQSPPGRRPAAPGRPCRLFRIRA